MRGYEKGNNQETCIDLVSASVLEYGTNCHHCQLYFSQLFYVVIQHNSENDNERWQL